MLAFRRNTVPVELPPSTPLLNIPKAFCKILDRDLKAAGIPKRDDRGRTIDVHALRHTFGTMLSKAGVSPRAAMRHSSLDLTMNVYTDPRLLDVQGAVESLPEFTVTNDPNENRQRIAAGAESLTVHVSNLVAPLVAPTSDFSRDLQSTAVTLSAISSELSGSPEMPKTAEKSAVSRQFSKSGEQDVV